MRNTYLTENLTVNLICYRKTTAKLIKIYCKQRTFWITPSWPTLYIQIEQFKINWLLFLPHRKEKKMWNLLFIWLVREKHWMLNPCFTDYGTTNLASTYHDGYRFLYFLVWLLEWNHVTDLKVRIKIYNQFFCTWFHSS